MNVILAAMDTAAYSTWLEIDLDAIRQNLRELRRISGVQVMAIVKANGYGHGIVEAGRAALQGGANWLGVARIDEALVLREANVTGPILVLGYTAPLQAREAALRGISLAAFDLDLARTYSTEALKAGQRIRVHAKFDTGMGRLGVFPENGVEFIQQLIQLPGLELEGMFTHFARSDEPDLETTDWQISRFQKLVERLSQAGLRPPLVHACNSAGALYFPKACYDMVRCGIAIYGLQPSAEAPLPGSFKTALTWKAHLASVKMLPAAHGVGYSYRYVTQQPERIGTVAVGYGDGFRRRVGNFALIGGKRVKLAGGVCMDQIMLRIDEVPEARVGDEVVLIGCQGDAEITAEELGAEWNTVNYDVVCGLQARVPRVYLNQGEKSHEA
jgi:alanine racemase